MKTTFGKWITLWLIVTLMCLAACLTSCAPQPVQVKIIPADRMLISLPDGNYRVTPLWLKERYEFERYLKEKLTGYEVAH